MRKKQIEDVDPTPLSAEEIGALMPAEGELAPIDMDREPAPHLASEAFTKYIGVRVAQDSKVWKTAFGLICQEVVTPSRLHRVMETVIRAATEKGDLRAAKLILDTVKGLAEEEQKQALQQYNVQIVFADSVPAEVVVDEDVDEGEVISE